MGMHYRSESSSSLTNEQIDENFRTLSENKSVTGSVTLSGSLIPSDPAEFDLGSSENLFHSLYLSNNLTIVSGGYSASMEVNPEDLQPPTTYSIYPELDTNQTPFLASVLVKLEGEGVSDDEWATSIIELTSSWLPNDLPDSIYLQPSPYFYVDEYFSNNAGGMAVMYDDIVTGTRWLDRSRMYATDGVDLTEPPTITPNQRTINNSIGWWQSEGNLSHAIMGKTPFIWDNSQPYLWHFSNATTNKTAFDHPTEYAVGGRKAKYFHLITSGSAYENPNLEVPPYGDNDILVRIWNENITQFSYWFTLEDNEDNIHYYNISQSYDATGSVYYHQDSINPGRVRLVNNLKGNWAKTRPWDNSDNEYKYSWDYNTTNPFISSSCLLLSLRTLAGPYVGNGDPYAPDSTGQGLSSLERGYGPQDSPTASTLLMFSPTIMQKSGSLLYPRVNWYGTEQYGHPLIMNTNLYPGGIWSVPTVGNNIYNSYGYTPQQTNGQAGISGSAKWGLAWGYHQLTGINAWGSCTANQESNKTGMQIMPIIPLTTAHYPVSASSYWYTSSLSGSDLVFTKPNKSTFNIPLPTFNSNLYTGDGILSDNRIVDLNGYNLTFDVSNGETFTIEAGNTNGQVAIIGLTTSSYSSLVGYDTTDGTLSVTGITNDIQPYFYSTGSTNTNAEVNNDIKLVLGEVYNYQNPNYLDLDDSIYRVNTAGKYYINVNGTLGQDDEPSSGGLGWWKISLQVNGATVAESTAVQSGVGEHYGGLDLMYVGDFAIEDEIQVISNTSPPTSTSTISNTTYRFSAEYLND